MFPANQSTDFDLTSHNIVELENSDQVIKFFAQLGYDVDSAAELQRENRSLDTGDLKQWSQRSWQIGTDPNVK